MADRYTNPVPQYLSNIGLLIPGGKLFFFDSGTSTPKDTFNDPDETTANTNPLIIDGAGRVPNCFYDGAAKVRLTDQNDVLIWERDPVSAGGGGVSFEDYTSLTTYSQGDIVIFNDKLYRSKTNMNQNNQPDTALTQWEEVEFIRVYNSTTSYAVNEYVNDDGIFYRSRVSPNLDNTPASSPDEWANMSGLGKQTLFIPALASTERATDGAPSGSLEIGTNKVMVETRDFDAVTDEFIQFFVQMPKNWDAGSVIAQFVWSHAATTVNFGVAWAVQAVAFTDGDAIDIAFGTAVVTTDTGATTDSVYISAESGAITVSNTPAERDWVVFQVFRDVSDAGDTMAIDARLHGLSIIYTATSSTDD